MTGEHGASGCILIAGDGVGGLAAAVGFRKQSISDAARRAGLSAESRPLPEGTESLAALVRADLLDACR